MWAVLEWRKSHIRIWMVNNTRPNVACCQTQNQNEHRPSRTLSANVPLNDKYMISNNPGSFPIKESQINEWHQTAARMSILMSWLSLVTAQKPAAAWCQLSRFMRCHSQHNWHNVSECHTSAQKPSLPGSGSSHWSCDNTLCQNWVLIEIRSVRLRSISWQMGLLQISGSNI